MVEFGEILKSLHSNNLLIFTYKHIIMKNIIGYQIESTDGKHKIPNCFSSFEIMPEELANKWLELEVLNPEYPGNWKKVTVYEGDIEEPTIRPHLSCRKFTS